MPPMETVLDLVERSLEFRWDCGAVSALEDGHTTGWRVLPNLLTAHMYGGDCRLVLDGRRALKLTPGGTVVIPAGLRHRLTMHGVGWVSRWSHVDLTLFGGAVDALALLAPPLELTGPVAVRIGDVNQELAGLARPGALAHVARRKALGFELLALIAGASPPAPGALERIRHLQRLSPALNLIERDLGAGLSLPALAGAVGVSVSRLHALFHAALGMPPLRHLSAQRLRRAQNLLIGSDLPIQEVATRSGFGDPFHFSRIFRRDIGESPSAYRRRGIDTMRPAGERA